MPVTTPNPLVDPPPGAPDWLPNVDDEVSLRRLRWLIVAVFAAGVVAFLVRGADRPADPVLADAAGAPGAPRTPIAGFGEVLLAVVDSTGKAVERCLLLAETPVQHQKGLMGVRDLQGYGGMFFHYQAPIQLPFWMRNTPMPLSVAFFDLQARFVSAVDMEPCGDRDDCRLYGAKAPYRYAIEVPQGGLAELGATPGSRVEIRGPCPP